MSEAQLTNFLFNNLQKGGFKRLLSQKPQGNVYLYREVGNSAYVADICISIQSRSASIGTYCQKAAFVAIEVKISDWESGLYQAWRYNNFAEKSFLAIYKPHAEKVNMQEFIDHNIGLIIFNEASFTILHTPKDNKFRKDTYEASVREQIWTSLANTKGVCPTE